MSEVRGLVRPKLFNVEGSDNASDHHIINGNPTGISNLNQQKYRWVNPLYRSMIANFWIPQKVSLVEDKTTMKYFTEEEERAFKNTLSFLIFLDSFQTNNLPNIFDYVTNNGIKNLGIVQAFQEVVHTESYQYMLQELYVSVQRDEIYNMWRDNPLLKKRNQMIADIAEEFVNNPNEDTFIKVCCANLALEGIYFYQGFNLFDQLAHRGRAVGSQTIITYIRRDELTHVSLFINMLKALDQDKVRKYIAPIFEDAVQQEIEWCHTIYGNDILGITKSSSEQYVKHLADKRLIRLGIEPMFGNPENPYKHLEKEKRESFFEGAVSEYDTADSVDGWDDV